MAEVIDLTGTSPPEIIEISSDTSPGRNIRTNGNRKGRKKKGRTPYSSNGASSVQPLRAIGNKFNELNEPIPHSKPASNVRNSSSVDEPGLFFFDDVAAPTTADDSSPAEPVATGGNSNELLLPSHVVFFHNDGPAPTQVIPPPNQSSEDEEYIEYLEYEDRKAPGLIRYFDVQEEASNQSRSSRFKCKNCGAEGDHKTNECPVQICLTCGARDEHSTRSCPISKTCYACGMKGHINKTCPNRFSGHTVPSDYGDCGRCGSTEHNMNECPTLWRIYQYVNDEERILIIQSREQKKRLAIGEGGEGYVGGEMWCYNCAHTGHLGDDCNELPHPATFSTEYSAFSFHNITSGPFYDPISEPDLIEHEHTRREGGVHLPDERVPVDVGRRGKNKDKERLEKRFREQEDEGEDWFNDVRNVKKKQQTPSVARERKFKFGSLEGGSSSSMPSSGSGMSLLARIGDTREGRDRGKDDRGRERHESLHQSETSLRIRGAAGDQRSQEGKYANTHKTDWERESRDRWDGDRGGYRGSRRGHGPRYRGGYDR